jgi:capsid protein
VRRALARRSFEALSAKTRGYDGAAKGRRTDGWKAAGTSADAEIAAASGLLRDRMRDLTRNNPHAAKAVSVLVNNIVGSGIIPRAATGDARLDETVDRLWNDWSAASDADGQLDIFGLQTLAVREMIEAGEVLIRRRPRRLSDGLAVPLQMQVIEADLLDSTRSGDLADGGRLLQGIELAPCPAPWRCCRYHAPTPRKSRHPGERRAASLREAAHAGPWRPVGHAGDAGAARSR